MISDTVINTMLGGALGCMLTAWITFTAIERDCNQTNKYVRTGK